MALIDGIKEYSAIEVRTLKFKLYTKLIYRSDNTSTERELLSLLQSDTDVMEERQRMIKHLEGVFKED